MTDIHAELLAQANVDRFESDIFVPTYRPMQSGEWLLQIVPNTFCPGYWSGPQPIFDMPALMRGEEVWMSITPLEVESQRIGIEATQGYVAIFGLGMGWAAAATALREAVTCVTVVEQDPEVIALHAELDVFSQLPAEARAKIHVEQGDAYAWQPSEPVDFLMPDIWLPIVSDGRVEEVRRMQDNVQAKAIYFWGQELELARHAVAAGRQIDDDGIKATIADFDLPLVGAQTPDYAARTAAAAERWMRNRWL